MNQFRIPNSWARASRLWNSRPSQPGLESQRKLQRLLIRNEQTRLRWFQGSFVEKWKKRFGRPWRIPSELYGFLRGWILAVAREALLKCRRDSGRAQLRVKVPRRKNLLVLFLRERSSLSRELWLPEQKKTWSFSDEWDRKETFQWHLAKIRSKSRL